MGLMANEHEWKDGTLGAWYSWVRPSSILDASDWIIYDLKKWICLPDNEACLCTMSCCSISTHWKMLVEQLLVFFQKTTTTRCSQVQQATCEFCPPWLEVRSNKFPWWNLRRFRRVLGLLGSEKMAWLDPMRKDDDHWLRWKKMPNILLKMFIIWVLNKKCFSWVKQKMLFWDRLLSLFFGGH